MLNKNQEDAIYDAISGFLGFEGVWEFQKNISLKGKYFSVKTMYPGLPIQRKASMKPETVGEREKKIIRLRTTLRFTVFEPDNEQISTISDSRKFHRTLNEGGVVCHGILGTYDVTFAFPEWNRAYSVDLDITYVSEVIAQDDYEDDSEIEQVGIEYEVGDLSGDMEIPE